MTDYNQETTTPENENMNENENMDQNMEQNTTEEEERLIRAELPEGAEPKKKISRYTLEGHDTETVRVEWLVGDVRHRVGGPALTEFTHDGKKIKEVYYDAGVQHREDGPTMTEYHTDDENNAVKAVIYKKDGLYHREGEPAIIVYYKSGNVEQELWFQNDDIHREAKPAKTYFQDSEKKIIKTEVYFLNNKQHNMDGRPSRIEYDPDTGLVKYEIWLEHGEPQGMKQPMFVQYGERDGSYVEVEWRYWSRNDQGELYQLERKTLD